MNIHLFFYFDSDSGSSSSGSESHRSVSEKSAADLSHHSDDTKSSPKHSNANSSKSGHHTDRNSSDYDSPSKSKSRNSHSKVKSDLWEENPDIYGIRRSGRSRKEPDRLKLADSDSSERDRAHSRKSRKKRYKIVNSHV